MAIDPEIAAQLQAEAEQSLGVDDEADGTATVEKKVDPPESDDDSAAADEGESSDESEEDETDDEEAVSDDEEESDDESEDDESEDEDEADEDDDDLDLDDIDTDEDQGKKKGNRAQTRIKDLHTKWKNSEAENAVLKAQLATKDGTPAEKKAADDKLLKQGYTPEQIAEGKKFLEALGYLPPEKVADLQKKIQKNEDDKLIAEDRAELREALKTRKSDFTEKQVMDYVRKCANHSNPKIQARASLDYPAIIKLMSSKKTVAKVVDATIKAKKKSSPKIPQGGGGPVKKQEKTGGFEWDPGDPIGSSARLREMAAASLEDE